MSETAAMVTQAAAGPRPDAYAQVFRGPIVATDHKGRWEVTCVRRDYTGSNGLGLRFRVSVMLTPDPAAGLNITYSKGSQIYMWEDRDLKAFRRAVKSCIEYTPTPKVASALFAGVQQLIAALQEEDAYYAGADKSAARAVLVQMKGKGAGRHRRGECLMREEQRYSYHDRPRFLYLTRDDLDRVSEAQKVLNGHGMEADTHFKEFDRELRSILDAIDREKARDDLRRERRRLDQLMQTDPDFRRLVAHYAKARETAMGEHYLELAFRLFGYCQKPDDWDRVREQYQAHLAQYGLGMFELRELQRLAEAEYDVLPPVQAKFERTPGEFYYGDKVVLGGVGSPGRVYDVRRCGREYLELGSGGGRQRKSVAQHYATWLRRRSAPPA